jgi:predicted secreted protein
MAASGAKSGFGTLIELSDGGATPVFTPIAEVLSIKGPSASRDTIEVTHMESPGGWKEFIGGLVEGGEITLELNFVATEASQSDLLSNLAENTPANVVRTYRIVFPDDAQSISVAWNAGIWEAVDHGMNTVQPVRFLSGTKPAEMALGRWYFAARFNANEFTVHATSAAALAGAGAIEPAIDGWGTIRTGSILTFTAACTGFDPAAEISKQLTVSVRLKPTGVVTLTPAEE